jgi:hypothetical protein
MNTAQLKAFICDPQTTIKWPRLAEYFDAQVYPHANVKAATNWKRDWKVKIPLNDYMNSKYDDYYAYDLDEAYESLADGTQPDDAWCSTVIMDQAYFSNKNNILISRGFTFTPYEDLNCIIYTDSEDEHIVAVWGHID